MTQGPFVNHIDPDQTAQNPQSYLGSAVSNKDIHHLTLYHTISTLNNPERDGF